VARGSVLVVDDDDFTRMALAAVLTSLDYEMAGQAESVVQAMDAARAARIDVALIDLDLGEGPTGIDLAHGLRGVQPGIGILILSSYADPSFIGRRSRPMPEGAEFLTKQELGDARILDAALTRVRDMDPAEPATSRSPHPNLTESQIETMRLIAAGLTNAEIARRMWITEDGVNRAVTRLVKQLGLEVTKDRNARVLIARAYADMAGRTVIRD
jgi:DNA-binding NarL/FixJ family response regulator